MAKVYKVQQGDCMASIAFGMGFTWQSLWNHPGNADLKTKRKDPNLLYPGDLVHIPDRRLREENCATDQTHNFELKNVPIKLRMQFLMPDPDDNPDEGVAVADPSRYEDSDFKPQSKPEKPRANVPYSAQIDGKLTEGRTDGNGFVAIPISPSARSGRIVLNPGTPAEEVYRLKLGQMDPINEVEGAKKRLNNLGYVCGGGSDITPDFEAALSVFQEISGIPITGKLDDATRDKLKDVHGS
jgi:hypothetical protein